ncbi:hypothetical protein ACIBSW_37145 [Actinoplanes sp. NPDC049668]|uniref:hypothetical protein n=1 Tax=unclassified Actinoplanes TaxID=2626549 RepID=UPI0033AF16FC
MSYAMQPPVAAPQPAAPRRPASVAFAAILLVVMAVAGLAYAIAAIAIVPGTVDRFRDATGGSGGADVDGMVTVVWIVAAVGAVLAVILFALYVVLALGLRRGSNAARIATWVVSGLGLLAGCASTVVVTVQLGGDATAGTPEAALADAYPGSWLGLNVVLCVAQMAGYVIVGLLLLAAPGTFFGRAPKSLPPDPFANPALAGYPPVPAGYGPQPMSGYPAPPAGGYGSPYPSAPPAAGQPIPPGGRPQPGPDDEYWSRPSN